MENHFNPLCNSLPSNYQSTIDKLKTMPQLLKDEEQQLSKLISSSANVRKINERIITYLILKLSYNGSSSSSSSLARLCVLMNEFTNSTDSSSCIQLVRDGT